MARMNIFLVPYTWARHLAVSFVVGSAALLTWWVILQCEIVVFPLIRFGWRQGAEGAFLLSITAGVIAFVSVLADMSLRRAAIWWRAGLPVAAGLVSMILAMICCGMSTGAVSLLASKVMQGLANDPSFTSLRYTILMWAGAGIASGTGPLAARIAYTRKPWGIFDHLVGGLTSGAIGGAVWHYFGYFGIEILGVPEDLYYAPAFGLLTWGFLHGLLVWGVPAELYAGWIRVLSPHRFGHRIPIDGAPGAQSERFIGHFPRGLDMYLPADKGVAELHVSFVTDGQQRYALRGLSQHPTTVKRPLERVDLRYDPRRPAPLETDLQPEDRVFLGTGNAQTEVEFLLIPREER
jgi:hypothetical protein